MRSNQTFRDKAGCSPARQPVGLPSPDCFADVVCTIDGQGCFGYVNRAASTLWGYDPEELKGKKLGDIMAPEDGPAFWKLLETAVGGVALRDLLNYVRCKDGHLQPVIWSVAWQQGFFHCIVRDGSLRIAKEEKVRQGERRLYRAFRLARFGWWEWCAHTGKLVLSDELYALYGLAQRGGGVSLSPETFLELVHPEDLRAVEKSWALIPELSSFRYEHRIIKPTGELLYVRHEVETFRDKDGRLTAVHGTTRDITGSKVSEQALEASQQKLEQFIESLGDGFFAVDRDWTVRYWNRKVEQITRIKREDILGKKLWDVYNREAAPAFYREYSRAMEQDVPVYLEAPSPTFELWLQASAYPSAEGLSVFLRDCSVQKKEQQQRRLLDEKLRVANENLRRVLDSMSDGFFTLDRSWTITYANERVAAMLGIQKEEMVGRNVWEWLPLSVHTKFYTAYHRAFAENTLVSAEDFLPHFNRWFEANAYPNGDELAVFVRNIDERKRQEQALQVSIERFHFVSMATSDVVWDWNLETGELYINQSFTGAFGYELAEGTDLHRLWRDNLHPDDRDRVISTQEAALENPAVFQWEDTYRFIKRCGETAYVTDRAVIIRNSDGAALRMVGAVQDITEHKRQEQRLEFIARASSELIWERCLKEDFAYINSERFGQLYGFHFPDNRLPVAFWIDNIHPEDRVFAMACGEQALERNLDFFKREYRFKKSDGSWSYCKERVYIVRNDIGKPVAMIGALEDISGERRARQAVVESEQRYRQLFNSDPFPKLIFDPQTLEILDINNTAMRHYGYSREEFTQMSLLDLRPKEEYKKAIDVISEALKEGSAHSGVLTHIKKNGEQILVEVFLTRTCYREKAVMLATIKEVTDQIRLQQALVEQQLRHQRNITKATIEVQEKERSEIGRELHDNVNQIITSAKLYVENMRYFPDQCEAFADKSVALLGLSIEEIRKLSRTLVTPVIRDLSFRETVRELADAHRDLGLFEVVCSFHFSEKRLSRELGLTLYRILQEAFSNTVKYARATLVQVSIEETGSELQLLYRDDGAGFNPELRSKGIGLMNIQNRADAYGGQVQLRSALGEGVELSITFPLGQAAVP